MELQAASSADPRVHSSKAIGNWRTLARLKILVELGGAFALAASSRPSPSCSFGGWPTGKLGASVMLTGHAVLSTLISWAREKILPVSPPEVQSVLKNNLVMAALAAISLAATQGSSIQKACLFLFAADAAIAAASRLSKWAAE